MDKDKLFEEPYASEFDRRREMKAARDRMRLTYSCHNAIVDETGLWVRCREGFSLERRRKSGMVSLKQVLAGFSPKVCQDCPKFEGGE